MATLAANNPTRFTNLIQGYATTVTAAGTTTLTATSAYQQFFTGTTTQTVRLPLTTTLVNGMQYMIVNTSTNTVTVQTNGGAAITTVATGTDQAFTCINNSVDAATSWSFQSSALSPTLAGDVTGPIATNTVDFIQSVRTVATTGATSRISFGNSSPNSFNGCIGIGSTTFPSSVGDTSNSVGIGVFAGGVGNGSQSVCIGYGCGQRLLDNSTAVGFFNGSNSATSSTGASDAFGSLVLYPHTTQTQLYKRAVGFGSQSLSVLGAANFFSDDNNSFGYLNFESQGLKPGTGNVCMGFEAMKYNYDGDYSVGIGYQAHFSPLGTRVTSTMTQTSVLTVTVDTAGQPTMTPQMMGLTLRQRFNGYTADRRILNITSSTVFTVDSGANFTSQFAYPLFPTSNNVAIGAQSLENVQSQYNVAVGYNALTALTVPSFTSGTVSVTNGTTTVTGVDTSWNVNWNITRAYIAFGSTYPYKAYQIASINSQTSLTLSTTFAETTLSGSAYVLSLGGEAPGNIAIGYNAGSSVTSGTGNILIGGYTGGTAPVSATGHDNIVFSDPSAAQKLVMAPHTSRVYNSPSTINAASYSQAFLDASLIFTTTNCTLTLLSAATYPGQTLIVKNVTANSVTSNASNVYPLGSNTLGTAILTAVAGTWAMLQSDGANWRIMMAN
jgi:hypothetical protein